jgi:hypothetical protein
LAAKASASRSTLDSRTATLPKGYALVRRARSGGYL